MAKFELTDAQIAEIAKSLPGLTLTAAVEEDVSKGLDVAADPAADVLVGIYNAVQTISKSDAGDKQSLIADVFEKGWVALAKVRDETVELAYEAGAATVATVAKADTKKKPADAAECNPDDENEDDDNMEKFLKGLPAQAVSAFTEINKANDELKTRIAKMEDENLTRILKAQAAEIGEPETFVETLKALDAKTRETVVGLIKAKNAQIKKGGLFAEVGGGSSGGTSGAIDQINSKAADLVKSSNGAITLAKAFGQVCASEPALYAEYKRETYGK